MDLTVVGCSGSVPSPTSPASSYVLRTPGAAPLVMDLGNGALGALQRLLNPSEAEWIVSHSHPDHTADFPALTVWRRWSPQAVSGAVPVWGPSDLPARVGYGVTDDLAEPEDVTDTLDFRSFVEGQTVDVCGGAFRVTPFAAVHQVEAWCVRVEETATGRTLAYSGDTGLCPGLLDAALGVDLFLCEATWTNSPRNPPGMHLCGSEAGRVAEEAGVGRLVVTHLPPWADTDEVLAEVRREYSGEVALAAPGATWTV